MPGVSHTVINKTCVLLARKGGILQAFIMGRHEEKKPLTSFVSPGTERGALGRAMLGADNSSCLGSSQRGLLKA